MVSQSHAGRAAVPALKAFLVVAFIVPFVLFGLAAAYHYAELEQGARARAERTSIALAEHAQRVFAAQEAALERIDERTAGLGERELRSPALHRWLRQIADESEYVVAVSLIDASGDVLASSLQYPTPATNARDRTYFQAFADAGRTAAFVSEPIVGRPTGIEIFQLARPRSVQGAAFSGVLIASVTPSELAGFYRQVTAPGDSVTLARADGTVLVRFPVANTGVRRLPSNSGLMRSIRGEPRAGFYETVSHLDGVERLHAYRKVGQRPVYVSYGSSVKAIGAQWRHDLAFLGAITGVASLLLLGLGAIAIRRARSEQSALAQVDKEAEARARAEAEARAASERAARAEAEIALLATEERLRAIADAMPVLISYVDSEQRFRFVNKAYEDWFGRPLHEIAGQHLREVMGEDMYLARRSWVERALAGERVSYEVSFDRQTGSRTTVVQHIPHVAADGRVQGMYALVQDITEQRQIELALRESEARLARALEAGQIGDWEMDLRTEEVRWSHNMRQLVGLPENTPANSRTALEVIHPDDRPAAAAAMARAIDHDEPIDLSFRVVGEDTKTRWIASRGVTERGEDGRPIRLVGVNFDVSAIRQAEEALRRESQSLETLNRTGTALASELDLERVVQLVTDAGVELTGAQFGAFFYTVLGESGEALMLYTLAGAERSDFERFGIPRATAVFRPTFQGSGVVRSDDITDDPRYGHNAPHKGMPDGHLPVRSYLAVPVTSRSGEALGGLFFGHPEPAKFSQRHERLMVSIAAQAAVAIDNARLFRNVQRANDTLEQRVAERTAERDGMWRLSHDLFLIINAQGTVQSINPAVTSLLGYSVEDLIGRHFGPYVHPDDLAKTADAIARATASRVSDFEIRLLATDGTWHWISWSAAPGDGAVYAVGRDVTLEKERALELEQVQVALRQSQKLESMGQLTGGVAHDFNNLLTPIIGSLDLLNRKGIADERTARLVDGALQSAERAKTLVQRLLAFARRQPLQPTSVELAKLVRAIVDIVSSTAGPRIKLAIEVPNDLPPVNVDANQLEMALLNLSVNARDAMPEGGRLTISARREMIGAGHHSKLPSAAYVRLAVSDTGMGMDDATLARAIEPFFSTKGIGKGTGLGLSMAHGLVAQLGGALTLESKLGVGTTVELWLPVAAEPVYQSHDTQERIDLAAFGTALLVDDEELVRASTANMLVDLGFAVVEATSAEEAMRLIQGGLSPNLVVSDHLMPGMTGTDLARILRASHPEVPLLIISGYAEDEGMRPDLPRLTKPFRQSELISALARLPIRRNVI